MYPWGDGLWWLDMIRPRKTAAQNMKFSIKYFCSKCDQIRSFLWICSHLLKKPLVENFIFCAVDGMIIIWTLTSKGNKVVGKTGKTHEFILKIYGKSLGLLWRAVPEAVVHRKKKKMFFKIGVLKNFAVFTGKHQYWSIFLIKLQVLGNLFWRTFVNDCFWTKWSPLNFFRSSCLMNLITTLYFLTNLNGIVASLVYFLS